MVKRCLRVVKVRPQTGSTALINIAGASVVGSGSPSDRRAVHKLRVDLRRHGLVLTP